MPLGKYSTTLAFLILLPTAGSSQDWAFPEKGILDLRNYDFNEQWYLKLDGEWEFYWETFVTPEAFEQDQAPEPTLWVEVPGYWKEYEHETIDFRGEGYATYRLRILLPKDFSGPLGFEVPAFDASIHLYLDHELVWSSGTPGDSWANSEAAYEPGRFQHIPTSDTVQVLIHASNFHHRRGAF